MKFKLSNIFAIIHFGFFLGIFSLFIYWQFKTIKEFHNIELNNFFNQTNSVVNLLVEKQQKEIKDLIHSNLHNYLSGDKKYLPDLGNIDFVFFTDGKNIVNIDGFSLIADVNIIAQNLKNKTITNNIVNLKLNSKDYYFLVHKEKVIDEKLGKVKGEIWGVILLNDNQIFLEDIRKNLNLKEIIVINKNKEIIASTIKIDNISSNIQLDKNYNELSVSADEKFIYRKNNIFESLDIIYMLDNNYYNDIYGKYIKKAWWVITIFMILGLFIYVLVKYSFIQKMDELKVFIENSFTNKNAKYKESNIKELDDISIVFKELFQKFNQNKSFQETLIQTLPLPFFSKDKDLRYNEFNDAFLNMIGKEREELIYKSVYEISPKELADIYHEADLKLIKDVNQIYESKVLYADGKQHDVVFFKASIFNEKGDFEGLLGVIVDISNTKTMQLELEELNKNLEEQVEEKTKELKNINSNLEKRIEEEVENNRKKDIKLYESAKNAQMGEMIENIAHQWRQPLSVISTAVSGMSFIKEFYTLTDEEFKDKTQVVMKNVKYLSETIDTFRNYIKEKNELMEVVLQERIDNVLGIVHASLQNNHIELIKEIVDTPIKYRLVQGELSQVIINLINNAKDALNNNSIDKKWIKIGLYETVESIVIYVEDNGGGVAENIKEKIFNPYFTTKHQSQGTGIGLHMSKDIIQRHLEGKLYMENTSLGAKFIIELPKQD